MLQEYAYYHVNAGGKTQPVAKKKANSFGLFDVNGNVREWVEDCYDDYKPDPSDGSPVRSGDCIRRVVRGGAWNDTAGDLRSAYRLWTSPDFRNNDMGFRVGRTLTP